MKILFIRHGLTAGNLEKRYIGSTDEPLCSEGITQLKTMKYPQCGVLICSPMKRCIKSAEILFPGQICVTDERLSECDFGDFEGKNYTELADDIRYQKWIDSGGTLPFPDGESPEAFKKRCNSAFESIVTKNAAASSIAFVVHGGTIMSILEKHAVPRRPYFDWHCENGHGYVCEWDGFELHITEKI